MSHIRLIARLDIKGPNLVKTVQLEGLRVVGDPRDRATRYYDAGIDELLYMDIVASLYGRNNLHEIVTYTAENIFVPLTVGGGIRSVEDVRTLLLAGADKIAINTAAIKRPQLITDVAKQFGSQCMVLSVEAKKIDDGRWECFTDNGRERTGLDVVDWVRRGEELGAGEILVTSVDREGARKGFDLDLTRAVSDATNIPVITSGGMGAVEDMVAAVETARADAVATAALLHFDRSTVPEIRRAGIAANLELRRV